MLIKNGLVLDGKTNRFEKTDILLENDNIKALGTNFDSDEIFDAEGAYIIAGFVDTHIHGCVGVEFASADEDFGPARKWLASEGTTSIAATVRALPPEIAAKAEKNIVREAKKEVLGASVEGINLEGPFVSREKSGVMNPPDIECTSDAVRYLAESAEGMLKIITIAPERENACDAIKTACEYGVNASIGHTNATYVQTMAAIDSGATRATHTFNAMRPLSHRETGVLGAVLTDSRVNCEMICDLVHLDEATIRIIYGLKGYENITLVSDTGFMSGLGDGEFIVDGRKRVVKDGVCRNAEGRIAGSCVSMLAGARNLLRMGIPLEEISVMASLNPARALDADKRIGSIESGKRADLIVCDGNLNIKAVFVKGKRI